MSDIYLLSDSDIKKEIGSKIRELRLKQNLSQSDLAKNAGLSLSSVIRTENGNIKSFDTFIQICRVIGRLEIFKTLVEKEPLSPIEYYKVVNSANKPKRIRATKKNEIQSKEVSK